MNNLFKNINWCVVNLIHYLILIVSSSGIFIAMMNDKCLDRGGAYFEPLCRDAVIEPTKIELILAMTIGYFIAATVRFFLLKILKTSKSEIKKVFVLQHNYALDNCEETKMIGVFHSQSDAEKVVDKFKGLPGFKEHQDAFFIDPYELNFAYWDAGFFTYNYDDEDRGADEKE